MHQTRRGGVGPRRKTEWRLGGDGGAKFFISIFSEICWDDMIFVIFENKEKKQKMILDLIIF